MNLKQNAKILRCHCIYITFMHLADALFKATYFVSKVYSLSVYAFPENQIHDHGNVNTFCCFCIWSLVRSFLHGLFSKFPLCKHLIKLTN